MNDGRGTVANSKHSRYGQSCPQLPADPISWAARQAVYVPVKGNRLQSPHNELVPVLIYVGVVFPSPLVPWVRTLNGSRQKIIELPSSKVKRAV